MVASVGSQVVPTGDAPQLRGIAPDPTRPAAPSGRHTATTRGAAPTPTTEVAADRRDRRDRGRRRHHRLRAGTPAPNPIRAIRTGFGANRATRSASHADRATVHRPRRKRCGGGHRRQALRTDTDHKRVVELAAGSSTPTELPFTDLRNPLDVAVDTAGAVYVADAAVRGWRRVPEGNNRVLKLAAGSSTQTVLPFTGLDLSFHVAVDDAGNLYVTDEGDTRVVKLPAG
jgi:hypothetical protein